MSATPVLDPVGPIADAIRATYADPLQHVMLSYPWGRGSLYGRDGPMQWQREFLRELGKEVRERGFDGIHAVPPIRFSTASGHGIGKSALVAWLIKWIMDTRPAAKGTVTATTVPQLRTKTWGELAKWHRMSLTRDWFTLTAGTSLALYHREYPEDWRVEAQTSKRENSEAFAGQHAANSTSFYIFDEASGVPDEIYDVREGGLTDGHPMVFDFGNPTRASGRFYENMVGRFRDRYIRRHIDSRDVEQTNKELFAQWAEDYGVDSDFFKVRVRGMFPASGSIQFFPQWLIDQCVSYEAQGAHRSPLVFGVDAARFGGNANVIYMRQGRDAETHGRLTYREKDGTFMGAELARLASEKKPAAIFVDGTGGWGGSIVDNARRLGVECIEIQFASTKHPKDHLYANQRTYMYGELREAMKEGLQLPNDPVLLEQLANIEYGFKGGGDKLLLAPKDADNSPDDADALALTFAQPVMLALDNHGPVIPSSAEVESDYDPFGD